MNNRPDSVVNKRSIDHPHPVAKVKTSQGTVVKAPEHQFLQSNQHTQFFQFLPQGAPVIFGVQSSQIDYVVSSTALSQVKFCALEIPIQNNSTTDALELLPPPFFVTQIEVKIANQNVEVMYPEGLWHDGKYMTDEMTELYAQITGNIYSSTLNERDSAGLNPFTIPVSSTRSLWLVMPNTFLQQTKVPVNSIVNMGNNTITFRFYFQSFANITASTNTMTNTSDCVVLNTKLWLGGCSINYADVVPFDGPHSYTFRQYERNPVPIGSLAHDVKVHSTLSNFAGLYSQIIAFLRPQGAVQEQQFQCSFGAMAPNYLPAEFSIYNSTLYDANSMPYSSVNLPVNLQALGPAFITDDSDIHARFSTFATKYPYVQWDLDNQPWCNHYSGAVGGLFVNNNWFVDTYPWSGYTTKNTEIVFLGARVTELKVDPSRNIIVGVPQ